MKLSSQAGLILTGLALTVVGCESPKEAASHVAIDPEKPPGKIGPPTTPGPVEPAPGPLLPFPGTPEAKALSDAKAAEVKAPEVKPSEPKPAEVKPVAKPAEPKS